MLSSEKINKNVKNMTLSSDISKQSYSEIIEDLKNKSGRVINFTDIVSFYDSPTLYYGLCDYQIQSDCYEHKCPFDAREENVIFNTYDDKLSCYKWYCKIAGLMDDLELKPENLTDIPEEHRNKFKNLIKRTLGETFIKY